MLRTFVAIGLMTVGVGHAWAADGAGWNALFDPDAHPGDWNEFELSCDGHSYSVRMNGELVTTWTNPKQRSSSGHIGLQNYNDGKTVRFRNLRVKELP